MISNKNLNIVYVSKDKITNSQQKEISRLQDECFGDVSNDEIKEHFFIEGFAMLLAYYKNKLVGILELHKRKCEFNGVNFLLGGAAGVCVTKCMQRKGIATKLMKEGLKTLRENKCDVACLNIDFERQMYSLYEKIGFKFMDRAISFDDIHGKRIYEKGAMFIPVCSPKIYDHIMNSRKTFHYGRGYW